MKSCIRKLIKSFQRVNDILQRFEVCGVLLLYRSKMLSQRVKENSLDMDDVVAEVSEYRTGKK